jgi:iron complex transport system substrate-binding protein
MVNFRQKKFHYCLWCLLGLLIALLGTACHHAIDETVSNNNQEAVDNCQVIQHTLGRTCVPTHPQRVIALNLLDNVLALGVQPVGTTIWHSGDFLSFLSAGKSQDITSVGLIYQPNIESILKLKPDLILDVHGGHLITNNCPKLLLQSWLEMAKTLTGKHG